MKLDARSIGVQIRVRRHELKMTVYDLAAATGEDGVAPQTISRLENGLHHNPSYITMELIARALGWSPNELARRCGMYTGELDTG